MRAQIKEIDEIVIAGRKFLNVMPNENENFSLDFTKEWTKFFEDIKDSLFSKCCFQVL